MILDQDRSYDFTRMAWDGMYQAVDNEYFQDMDSELIYQSLEKELKPVPFGDYLKRYIYQKAGMTGSFREVSLKDYQLMIIDAFRDHGTPPSFTPTTAKLSALSKNWLTQQSVKRNVVLLLGFGLGMSAGDVNMFLHKALHETTLNMTDPFETICAYCYEHGYGYYKFESLRKIYEQMKPGELDMLPLYDAQPAGRTGSASAVQDDAKLMSYLMTLKGRDGSAAADDLAYKAFIALYDEARDIIAESYDKESMEESVLRAEKLREDLERNDRLFGEDKQKRVQSVLDSRKKWTREDISESDLERILCSSIPLDSHGNLTPSKRSSLNAQFEGKRFSRKHINEILHRNCAPERFDLITLNFLIHAERVDREQNAKKRYISYIESTNRILKECNMGPLYVANPYECFVLMCILSVSPLETYADVMEMSYSGE